MKTQLQIQANNDRALLFIGFQVAETSILCSGNLAQLRNFKYLLIQGLVEDPSMIFIAGSDIDNMNDRNKQLLDSCENGFCVDLYDKKVLGTYPIASIFNNECGGRCVNTIVSEKRLKTVNKILTGLGIRNI